jgi:lipid II:glycine glycyltransferase (peptidoglycan interpeptide bridge formation enzyme)
MAKQEQAMVAEEEAKATLESEKAKALADEAEKQCSDAQKQLDETLEKVKELKKDHLNEIKGFNNPAPAVVTVCAGLVILFWDWIMANGG